MYLFKYKAGFQSGQATKYERLGVRKRSGDAQATEDLGNVSVTTGKINGTGLHIRKPMAGNAATGGQPQARTNGKEPMFERSGPMFGLSRLHEKLSDL